MRQSMEDVIYEAGADLVLNGHLHTVRFVLSHQHGHWSDFLSSHSGTRLDFFCLPKWEQQDIELFVMSDAES